MRVRRGSTGNIADIPHENSRRGRATFARHLMGQQTLRAWKRSIEPQRSVPDEDREIGRRRVRGHLVEHVGDVAAMIGRVVGEMQRDLRAGHRAFAAFHEREVHFAIEFDFSQPIAPVDVPSAESTTSWREGVSRPMV